MASIINISKPHLPITTNTTRLTNFKVPKTLFHFHLHQFKLQHKFKFCATSSFSSTPEPIKKHEKFEWFSQWYPIAPVCDLDKKVPHAKRVMGIDLVVWWDKNEYAWKVFDDRCPHRLAPLSEGRIDQHGRLQCVYHGWCFSGSGDCNSIPQSPHAAPPFHTFKKACVSAYPCIAHNGIVWFWPNSDLHDKDIILTQRAPPLIRELDDPTFTHTMGTRDFPYGYEVLVENLIDPAHIPYAHYQLLRAPKGEEDRPETEGADREGGRPMYISVQTMDRNGFLAHENNHGLFTVKFVAPCLIFLPYSAQVEVDGSLTFSRGQQSSDSGLEKKFFLVLLCIPVCPGKSRLIWSFPRNVAVWVDNIVPRWIFHLEQNLILDSDMYLLYMQEQRLMEIGVANWQKAYFVPTKSDAMVVAFRKWLTRYAGGQVNFGSKFDGTLLPPMPPRQQLMDRYWSHVKNCTSCSAAYNRLKITQMMLQLMSFGLIGLGSVAPLMRASLRISLVSFAVIYFVGSKCLSHFIYKNFSLS